jgi:hypothetical protein
MYKMGPYSAKLLVSLRMQEYNNDSTKLFKYGYFNLLQHMNLILEASVSCNKYQI